MLPQTKSQMKRISSLLTLSLILSVTMIFTACKDDDGDGGPDPIQERLDLLSKSWNFSTVSLDTDDRTADFAGASLTVTASKSYSTTSVQTIYADVWPASGTFDFGTGTDGSPDPDTIIRSDGVTITIDNINDTGMTLRFNFVTASANSGSSVFNIEGEYICTFTAQ